MSNNQTILEIKRKMHDTVGAIIKIQRAIADNQGSPSLRLESESLGKRYEILRSELLAEEIKESGKKRYIPADCGHWQPVYNSYKKGEMKNIIGYETVVSGVCLTWRDDWTECPIIERCGKPAREYKDELNPLPAGRK